MAIVILRRRH